MQISDPTFANRSGWAVGVESSVSLPERVVSESVGSYVNRLGFS